MAGALVSGTGDLESPAMHPTSGIRSLDILFGHCLPPCDQRPAQVPRGWFSRQEAKGCTRGSDYKALQESSDEDESVRPDAY